MWKLILGSIALTFYSLAGITQNWVPVGVFDREITTLFSDSHFYKLYAGGMFMQTDGMTTRGVCQWNGEHWDTLQSGVEDYNASDHQKIWRFISFNNNIYLLGAFDKVGHVYSNRIAKWNGINWDSLTLAPNDATFNGFVNNGELIITGAFDSVCNLSSNGIAKFNNSSCSDIHALPRFDVDGVSNNLIFTSLIYQNSLYVAGNFYGDSGFVDISYWDGLKWKDVDGGIKGNLSEISSMAIFQNKLYVAGFFRKNDGNAGNSIMAWNGNSWSDVGGGMDGSAYPSIRDMKVINEELYVVGYFLTAGGIPANNIAKWDGSKWCSFGSVFDNIINTIELYDDSIYIGGAFSEIDGDSIFYIAKWTGGNFTDTCSTISINENESMLSDFYIYPTPSVSFITLSYPSTFASFHFTLSDALGRELKIDILPVKSTIKELDISELAAGIYFITLQSESGRVTKRFVKE